MANTGITCEVCKMLWFGPKRQTLIRYLSDSNFLSKDLSRRSTIWQQETEAAKFHFSCLWVPILFTKEPTLVEVVKLYKFEIMCGC